MLGAGVSTEVTPPLVTSNSWAMARIPIRTGPPLKEKAMRIAILVLLALLAGCNSSDDDSALQQQISAVPNEATAVQALRAQVFSLTEKIGELQLIGKIKGQ